MLEDVRIPEGENDASDPFHMLLETELTGKEEVEKEEMKRRRLAQALAGQGVVWAAAGSVCRVARQASALSVARRAAVAAGVLIDPPEWDCAVRSSAGWAAAAV